jgi:hypothetical protein
MNDIILAVPTTESRNRSVRMLWPVGELDDRGFQTYAELNVTYNGKPNYRYVARLRQTRMKEEEFGRTESFSVFGRRELTIEQVDAPRFNARRMGRIADSVLRTARTRYEAGVAEVTVFFEGVIDDG